ncbi:MAG: hypothetical protein A3J29_03435 [Acidobacteria bacterium RIFCSPLOWO2_12_FULL_67_14b]|nr:MAG: hypothetical protein A3J29_03435 [Acidobacteria bacterium RIFCSPLOWO2_12_FULL_67_14b]
MSKTPKGKPKREKKVKFNLGRKALTRALQAAQAEAERSIAVGTKKVAAAKKSGNKAILASNRFNLAGAKSAKRFVGGAIKQMNAMDCLDQFMNCDPEYF